MQRRGRISTGQTQRLHSRAKIGIRRARQIIISMENDIHGTIMLEIFGVTDLPKIKYGVYPRLFIPQADWHLFSFGL